MVLDAHKRGIRISHIMLREHAIKLANDPKYKGVSGLVKGFGKQWRQRFLKRFGYSWNSTMQSILPSIEPEEDETQIQIIKIESINDE